MTSKICAGIVTYNPVWTRLEENISHIIEQVDRVYICDNGSNNIDEINEKLATFNNRVVLNKLFENKGIAFALNQLCNSALVDGFEWILTLDQDSVSPESMIEGLTQYTNKGDIAIVAPDIIYRNNEDFVYNRINESDEVEWVITSASLTSLSIWKTLGGFDEQLFIDKVDYEYCYRARNAGYKIIRVNKVKLLHELGDLHCRKVFGRIINVTNHSAFRCYYMARNEYIVKKKLGVGQPDKENFKLLIKVIMFEKEKRKKCNAIFKGIREGKAYALNGE